MRKVSRRFFQDQSGSLVMFAIVIIVVLGMAALALDIGHLVLVKSDLQKAADAGALAGARALGLDPSQANGLAKSLNWSYGIAQATDAVQKNCVDRASLNPTAVQAGYWNINWTMSTAPPNLNGYLNPAAYVHNPAHEIPAIKVTIAKATGGTEGNAPVQTMFATVFNIDALQAKASCVAILPSPTTINPGGMFPFAIPKYWVNQHWADNPPTPFSVGSIQHDSIGGQWTTFEKGQVGASVIADLVLRGNDIPISLGDQIFIQSGEESSVYNTVSDRLRLQPNNVYMIAVVDRNPIPTGTTVPVDSFVPFLITGCSGSGATPYVTGHFVPGYMSPKAAGVSGIYNGDPSQVRVVN